MLGLFRKQKPVDQAEKVKIKRVRSIVDSGSYSDQLLKDLIASSAQTNSEVINALANVRNRSRTLYHNSDYLRKFVLSAQRNVVGESGAVLRNLSAEFDGRPDEIARNIIEQAWNDFGEFHIDYTGRFNLQEILDQWVHALIVDGAFLAIKQKGASAGKYGFSIQPLDPSLLDLSLNEAKNTARGRIIGGIEFDVNGRVKNYYILDSNFGDYHSPTTGKKYKVLRADRVIYSFIPEFVGQTHGIPKTWSSINTLHQIAETEKSALIAARHGATKMGFIVNKQQGDEGYIGDYEDDDGYQITELRAGAIEELPYGKEYVEHDPKYPHEQLSVFMKAQLRKLAASWGMSYADLTDDLEAVNLSSFRGSTNESRETWKRWQRQMIKMLSEIYREWLEMSLLKGELGQLPEGKYDKFAKHQFQAKRWYKLDPVKDEQANQLAHSMRTKSLSEIIRESGRDPEKVFAELAEEKQRLESLGLTEMEVVQNDNQDEEES
jgi:lambda family phage portal protein